MKNEKEIIEIEGVKYGTLLSEKRLKAKIKNIAKKIFTDYQSDLPPVLLIVTNGGMYFGIYLSMMLQDIGFSCPIDTVRIKRYAGDEQATNEVKITSYPTISLLDRDVIVIEDIVDEGITLSFLNEYLKMQKAKSIEYCVLAVKKDHKKLDFKIKYSILNNLGPEWLVGFGMDANFLFRGLRAIYSKLN